MTQQEEGGGVTVNDGYNGGTQGKERRHKRGSKGEENRQRGAEDKDEEEGGEFR